jgi:hypothetical protein
MEGHATSRDKLEGHVTRVRPKTKKTKPKKLVTFSDVESSSDERNPGVTNERNNGRIDAQNPGETNKCINERNDERNPSEREHKPNVAEEKLCHRHSEEDGGFHDQADDQRRKMILNTNVKSLQVVTPGWPTDQPGRGCPHGIEHEGPLF